MKTHRDRVRPVSNGVTVFLFLFGFARLAEGGVFTIGGAIYTNLNEPFSSGLAGVSVAISCGGGLNSTAFTSGGQGLWSLSNVPDGICTITPTRTGYCFEHVEQGAPTGHAFITITVDAAHQQQNQSIQFLASTNCPPPILGACCQTAGTCSMATAEDCGGQYLGDRLTCSGDPDDDGVVGCDDVCPATPAPAGVDSDGRPLGDLTGDCLVALDDFQILQNNLSGPGNVASFEDESPTEP